MEELPLCRSLSWSISFSVLPTGLNFCRRTQNCPPEKSQRPRKSASEFYAEFLKNGRKGAERFVIFT
jgi:hypothetical protein